MYRKFNMGMGFFIMVNEDDAEAILKIAKDSKIVGEVKKSDKTRTILKKDEKNIIFEGY